MLIIASPLETKGEPLGRTDREMVTKNLGKWSLNIGGASHYYLGGSHQHLGGWLVSNLGCLISVFRRLYINTLKLLSYYM
jgi:hypothetical protein